MSLDVYKRQADNVGDIGSAAKKTAKDIEKSLAGFDQINKLTEPADDSSDSSGSTGGTSSGIGSVDLVPDVSCLLYTSRCV